MTGGGREDYLDLLAASKQQRKSVRRLPALIAHSARLAWAASPALFITTTTLQLIGGVIVAAQVLLIQSVLSSIVAVDADGGSVRTVIVPVALLAGVMAVGSILTAVHGQLRRLLGEKVARLSWQRILDVTAAVGLLRFEQPTFYDRLQRVQASASSRPMSMINGLTSLVGGLAGTIGLIVTVIALAPLVLPLLLLAGLPLFLGSRRASRLEFEFVVTTSPLQRLRRYLTDVQTGRDEAKEIRAFGLGRTLRDRFDRTYADYLQALTAHVRRHTWVTFVSNLASAVLVAATLVTLVMLVARGQLTLADAGAAIVAVRMIAGQMSAMFGGVQQIFESGLFLQELETFVQERPARAHDDDAGAPAPSRFDTLEVENVSFTYPGATVPALSDASMQVNAGEIVALVGENGSGKTTLAKLLAALYATDTGTIRWDGVDIGTYRRRELREAIAVIFQDFVRYQLSARENVGFGAPDRADDVAAIAAAARQAGAEDFLARLPDGFETPLSKMFRGGQDLSGGQWQRVAIARAFYRNAPFVILDEPTAALDPRAEHELFESLRHLLAGRTVLFISHRMSTVRSADRVYVMHEGRIVENGTHDELMAVGGRYAELFTLQAAAYLEREPG